MEKKECKQSFTNFFRDFDRIGILSIKRHLVDKIVMKWINFDFCLFFRMNPTRISCVTTIGVFSYASITFWANVWPRCTTKLSSSPVKKPRTKRIEKSQWRSHLDSNQRVSQNEYFFSWILKLIFFIIFRWNWTRGLLPSLFGYGQKSLGWQYGCSNLWRYA